MTPTVQLYWIRVVLGLVAGVITAAIAAFFGTMTDITTLVNSVTVALLIYFITYYVLKAMFKNKFDKQSKLLTTGIGMYFFSWVFMFVLSYTAIQILLTA